MAKPPLAVDLDGTLIKTDLFGAAMLQLATRTPWKLPLLAFWLLHGRAHAKAQLARLFPPDPAQLPYDERLVTWLTAERAEGRTIVLATAYDEHAAQAVADHIALFDAVFASDGRVNLKSHRKAERLAAAFPDGFVYAGNERADLAVWRAATAAVLVNAPIRLERQAKARFKIEMVFARRIELPRPVDC